MYTDRAHSTQSLYASALKKLKMNVKSPSETLLPKAHSSFKSKNKAKKKAPLNKGLIMMMITFSGYLSLVELFVSVFMHRSFIFRSTQPNQY